MKKPVQIQMKRELRRVARELTALRKHMETSGIRPGQARDIDAMASTIEKDARAICNNAASWFSGEDAPEEVEP